MTETNVLRSAMRMAGALLLTGMTTVAQHAPASLPMLANPEAAGWDAAGLRSARALAEKAGSAAVLAMHDGVAAVAWGDVERRFECHSVRKSLVSALFGVAVDRGLVDLDTTAGDLGIDELAPLSDVEKTATLADLLASRSGVYHPAAKETRSAVRNRPERHSRKPGEGYYYNNWDFNVAGIALQQAVGVPLFDAFRDWLAEPLGMEDYRARDSVWELEPRKSLHPAYAFRLSTRDLARFGMLFARGGKLDGEQLISTEWIERSTSVVTEFQGGRGYGLMWWVYPKGSLAKHPGLNEFDVFAASGTGGQMVLVVPDAGFVLVHRGDTDNNRRVRGGDAWEIAERVFSARPREAGGSSERVPLEAEPFEDARPAPPELEPAGPFPAEVIRAVVGRYRAPGLGDCEMFEHEGRLFAKAGPAREQELFWLGEGRFFMRMPRMLLKLSDDGGEGPTTTLEIEAFGRELEATRIE